MHAQLGLEVGGQRHGKLRQQVGGAHVGWDAHLSGQRGRAVCKQSHCERGGMQGGKRIEEKCEIKRREKLRCD